MKGYCNKLINVFDNFGKEWYIEIDIIILNIKKEIIEINLKYLFDF